MLYRSISLFIIVFLSQVSIAGVSVSPIHPEINESYRISWTSSSGCFPTNQRYKISELKLASSQDPTIHYTGNRYFNMTKTEPGAYNFSVFSAVCGSSGDGYVFSGNVLVDVVRVGGSLNNVVRYHYDELGRLTAVKDSVNGDRNYQYDKAGNRKKVTTN